MKSLKIAIVEEIKDYGTGTIVGDDIFDNWTHISYYDNLLKDKNYAKSKNLKCEIVKMSPNEYYNDCANKIFNSSVEHLKLGRSADTESNNELVALITKYKRKLFLPYIDYANQSQEGLHRMYVAGEIFGWNHKFNVLAVNYIDEDLANRQKADERERKIKLNIRTAVNKALEYTYRNYDELESQLEWELSRAFYTDDIKFELGLQDEKFIVTYNNVSYAFDYDDVEFNLEIDDFDLDFDDEDLDLSFDEFMKKYG